MIRPSSTDLCLCTNQGEICLLDLNSKLEVKSFNSITSEQINTIEYIPYLNEKKTHLLSDTDSSNEDLNNNSIEKNQDYLLDTIWIGTQSGKLVRSFSSHFQLK